MSGIIPTADQTSVFEDIAFKAGAISELHSYVCHKSSLMLAQSVSAGCLLAGLGGEANEIGSRCQKAEGGEVLMDDLKSGISDSERGEGMSDEEF